MAVTGIDALHIRTESQRSLEGLRKKRLELNRVSTFERGSSHLDLSAITNPTQSTREKEIEEEKQVVRLRDGSELEIPQLPSDMKDAIKAMFAKRSPEDQARLKDVARPLGALAFDHAQALATGGADLQRITSALTQQTQQTYEVSMVTTRSQKHEEAMQDASLAGMWSVETNMYDAIGKFYREEELSREVVTDVHELKDMLAAWPEGQSQTFTYNEVYTDENGVKQLRKKTVTLTREEAEKLLRELEVVADDLGTLSAIEQVSMQKLTHEYQQAMTTISNIMKTFEENLKGIIQNVKA
jgi:hypothetical protein